MKKLLTIIILASTLTVSAYEFKVGDVVQWRWSTTQKWAKGRILERVKRPGAVLFLRVQEFNGPVVEVHAADHPFLIPDDQIQPRGE